MPIKWRSPDRFKPALILKQIDAARNVGSDGGVSYTGLAFEEQLPTLQSMLQFPPAAEGVETETLVWRALSRTGKDLTPDSFLEALNAVLTEKLAVREADYFLLTSASLDPSGLPRRLKVLGAEIQLCGKAYPRTFASRMKLLESHKVAIPNTPAHYCAIVGKSRAKSDGIGFNKAMRAVDLTRALLNLMANPQMQIAFGYSSFEPINVIRLGSRHTVHLKDGTSSRDGLWYEPGFVPAPSYRFSKPDVANKNLRWAMRRLHGSKYRDSVISALLRFVRALDQSDPNIAFLRLWSALETLTTPDVADYDKLIRRTSFLFKEHAYHRQVLEHLRAQRNANAHGGEESENARIHCFQLQMYFTNAAWFYIRNALEFSSLDEANSFLDLPPEQEELLRRLASIKRALKFTSPHDA